MAKQMFDADALIAMFETATAKQGEQLRKATSEATLAALQGRELSLKNIRGALKQVADAASAGVAKNMGAMPKIPGMPGMPAMPDIDAEALLDKAVAGMDDALLKAVDANRVALSTLQAQGADMRDKHLTKALADLEKMEDTLFDTLKKAASGSGVAAPLAETWSQVLGKMQASGTQSGNGAANVGKQMADQAAQMADQMQTAMRSSRAASMKAASAMAESYTAMVSGVLIGMADALQAGSTKKSGKTK